jgi:hypothetical protein
MSPEWYYRQNSGVQEGPISAGGLKRLADAGTLRPDDMVWQDGMKLWVPAKQVKELFSSDLSSSSIDCSDPAFERSATAFARSREGESRHLFDRFLDAVRKRFPANSVDSTWRLFAACGYHGLYAAMAMSFVAGLVFAHAERNYLLLLAGVGVVFLLAVLQYAAGRFIGALDRLIRSVPSQLSSSAFLDFHALLHMIVGLVVLLMLAVWAVHVNDFVYILPGMAAFIVCQYAALLALKPEVLSLCIVSETGPAEEALGILAFLLKSAARLVPVIFGVGIVWGTITLIRACVLEFFPTRMLPPLEHPDNVDRLRHLPAEFLALEGIESLIAFALLPLLMYLVFVFCHLQLDLLRALLALPSRIDRLIDKNN